MPFVACVLSRLSSICLLVALPAAIQPAAAPYEYSQVHMGMPVRLVLHAGSEAEAAGSAGAAFARIAALDAILSDYRDDSELRRLERAGERAVPVSPELFAVLTRAREIARLTRGAFDPTVGPLVALWRQARTDGRLPARAALDEARARVGWRAIQINPARRTVRLTRPDVRLDLGGIAKGYVLDEALRTLRAHGIRRALVQAGGDIVVGDAPPGRPGWRIETAGADAGFARRASTLTNAALASSGPTEQFVEIEGVRYSHVIDPKTGLGLRRFALARVIAADGMTADAVSTALTVLDAGESAALLTGLPGVAASVQRTP